METACGRIFDVFTVACGAGGTPANGCGVLVIYLLASNAYPAYYWQANPATASAQDDQIPLLPVAGTDSTTRLGKVLIPQWFTQARLSAAGVRVTNVGNLLNSSGLVQVAYNRKA